MKKLFLLLAAIVTLAMSAAAQTRTIHGTVLNVSDDEPVAGATVRPIGGGSPCATDIDGKFTLKVPQNVTEATITAIGLKEAKVTLSDGMVVNMQTNSKLLDAVVVTGYGSAKKLGSVVGSVAVVGEQVFENTPVANFVDAMQGQVSGLAINSQSGDPSSTSNSIVLRGVSSLSQDVTPLFICDGAPIDEAFFTSMNPSDIESVTVLKDASSTAIYGSRGANGIIVITTKKGKFGAKAHASFRASYGWSQMVKDNITMMDSKQYMQFRDLIGAPLSADVQNLINTYGMSTNWRDEMFKGSAPTYSVDASVTGGSDNLSYYLGAGYYSQEGIIEHSGLKRETISWSLDAKVNDWFRIGFNGNAAFQTSETNDADKATDGLYLNNPMLLARMALPYDSPYDYSFNANGDLVYGSRSPKIFYSNITMPWWEYTIKHKKSTSLNGNMRLYEQITPIKGLIIRAQQAMQGEDYRYSGKVDPYKSYYTEMGRLVGSNSAGTLNTGSNAESFSRWYQFTYTNTAEYTFDFAKLHHARLLVGQESIITHSNGFGVSTSGNTDGRLNLLNQGTNVTMSNVSYSKSEYIINSYIASGNYDFDNRYFFDFSYRRDGNSKFAPGHRWSNFGAVGAMWNLKNEKFLADKTWLNDLRLHYSWGVVGNANTANWAWQGGYGTFNSGYNGETATGLSGASNYKLTWESIWSHDLGFNIRVFDRLSVGFDWYKRTTKDMLYSIPYSLTVGVSSGMANVCQMTNKGVETEINADLFKNKDWYIGARVQFAYNKNTIDKLWDGNDEFVRAGYGMIEKVGQVCDQFYAVRYVGVDPADGKQMWLDKNDNVTKVFPSDAAVPLGKSMYAPWTGGFGATVRWKGLSATANFVFQAGKYMFNNDQYFVCNPTAFGTSYNQSVESLNVWTTPGQVTNVPAFGEELQYAGDDTRMLENASFTRLKNLTVAYDLPKTLINKWGVAGIQFHFTGRNLWTITSKGFTGYDPEIQSNYAQFQFPNTRQYEFGVEVSF